MMQLASAFEDPPHPSTLPPKVFPKAIPWPDHIPIRHRPWTAQLEDLDAKNLNPPKPDLEDFKEWRLSHRVLEYEKYRESRGPYCELASQRLQAVVGLRNDYEFLLPKVVNGTPETPGSARHVSGPVMTPSLRRVLDSEVSMGGTSRKRARTATPRYPRLSGSFGSPGIDKERFEDGSMRSPDLEGFEVDRETGGGLRDYMLNMGRKHGMRRVVCDGFSFFDFTPSMKGGQERMQLLMHLIKQEGYQVEAYEIDIPTTYTNDANGEKTTINVTWIWFYISHTLIDIPSNGVQPPPTFPSPNPISWVSFALPLTYANKYDTVIEYTPAAPDTPSIPVSTHPFHPRPAEELAHLPQTLHKRTDYDISFSGMPIFEFSQKPPSVMVGWSAYLRRRHEVFRDQATEYDPLAYGFAGKFLNLGHVRPWSERGGGDPDANWWERFYHGVYEDVWAWERVKRAMGRGCLRLVVRWSESVGGQRRGVSGVGIGIRGMGISDDDEEKDEEVLEFERPVGFGRSRSGSLGMRGRSAKVPQPLSLGGGGGNGFGREQFISSGTGLSHDMASSHTMPSSDNTSFFHPLPTANPALNTNPHPLSTTTPSFNTNPYHQQTDLDPSITSLMDFHFSNSQLDGTGIPLFPPGPLERHSIFSSWPRRLSFPPNEQNQHQNQHHNYKYNDNTEQEENNQPLNPRAPHNTPTNTSPHPSFPPISTNPYTYTYTYDLQDKVLPHPHPKPTIFPCKAKTKALASSSHPITTTTNTNTNTNTNTQQQQSPAAILQMAHILEHQNGPVNLLSTPWLRDDPDVLEVDGEGEFVVFESSSTYGDVAIDPALYQGFGDSVGGVGGDGDNYNDYRNGSGGNGDGGTYPHPILHSQNQEEGLEGFDEEGSRGWGVRHFVGSPGVSRGLGGEGVEGSEGSTVSEEGGWFVGAGGGVAGGIGGRGGFEGFEGLSENEENEENEGPIM